MVLSTKITRLFNIRHPLILPGMSWISTPSLVAAVSNAGGLGLLATGPLSPDQTRESIREIRRLTDHPFGINTALLMPGARENTEVALDEKVPVINFSLGECTVQWTGVHCLSLTSCPCPYSCPCVQVKETGSASGRTRTEGRSWPPSPPRSMRWPLQRLGRTHSWSQVRCAATVPKCLCAPVFLTLTVTVPPVASGHEAAAHGGMVTSQVLVPCVAARLPGIPLVCAGGVASGAGLLAVLSLGASGAAMGSRFAVSSESPLAQAAKDRIVQLSAQDTIYGKNFDGMFARVMATPAADAAMRRPADPVSAAVGAFSAAGMVDLPLWKVLPGLLLRWDKMYSLSLFGAATKKLMAASVDGDLEAGVQFVGKQVVCSIIGAAVLSCTVLYSGSYLVINYSFCRPNSGAN